MKRLATILVLLLTTAAFLPGPVALAVISPTYGVVDLDAFGAVGDGSTDDAAALTAAVNSAGVLAVRLGPKTYAIGSAVTVPAGVAIFGQGMGSSQLHMASGWTGSILTLGSNCTIRDLCLDGNDDSSTLGGKPDAGATNVHFVRVKFSDFSTCSQDNTASKSAAYVGCHFLSSTTGFFASTASSGTLFDACYFDTLTTGVSFQSSSLSGAVLNCTFVAATTAISNTGGAGLVIVGNAFVSGTTSIVPAATGRSEIGENYWAFDETVPSDVTNTQTSLRGLYYGTASPSAGTWLTGDVVHNSTPGTAGTTAISWTCSTGGTSGTWQAIYRGLPTATASITWDPASMADNAGTSKSDFAVTGAALGSRVAAGAPYEIPAGVMVTATVVSSNTCRVSLWNHSGGVVDLASGNWTLEVTQ